MQPVESKQTNTIYVIDSKCAVRVFDCCQPLFTLQSDRSHIAACYTTQMQLLHQSKLFLLCCIIIMFC